MQSSSSSGAVNELLALLQSLRSEEEKLRSQFEGKLSELQGHIQAVQTTLDLYHERRGEMGVPDEESSSSRLQIDEWANYLRGLTHKEALRRIAEKNDGLLGVTDACRILAATGKAKMKPAYLRSHIYHLLADMVEFRRVRPGEYQLVKQA